MSAVLEDVDGDISSFDGVDRPRELNDVEASKVADSYVSYLNADIFENVLQDEHFDFIWCNGVCIIQKILTRLLI